MVGGGGRSTLAGRTAFRAGMGMAGVYRQGTLSCVSIMVSVLYNWPGSDGSHGPGNPSLLFPGARVMVLAREL